MTTSPFVIFLASVRNESNADASKLSVFDINGAKVYFQRTIVDTIFFCYQITYELRV